MPPRNALLALLCSIILLPLEASAAKRELITLKILGINDFHGQITEGNFSGKRPVGGAAVLAAYLRNAASGYEKNTVITMSGDQVGASVPASGLLNHEPSILFLNTLGNDYCSTSNKFNKKCNLVAAVGNHEFDNGQPAMFDLINGSEHPPKDNWIPLPTFPGASFPYLAANIVYADTGKSIFRPYVIKSVNGIPVAFIGAILENAASSILPSNVRGIKFLNVADTINHYIPEIHSKGANIIIVMLHEGGDSPNYEGYTQEDIPVNGDINTVVGALDDGVDVVMAGHTHRFLNAYLPNHDGQRVLVTQANSYSSAFSEVTLQVDRDSKTVQQKTARIITTYADAFPGTQPDAKAEAIVKLAMDSVDVEVNEKIGTLSNDLNRFGNAAGESSLGNLIADAFRHSVDADMGITNASSMRTNLKAGLVTWGHLYAVQPFGNQVVKMTFKGQDILDLLEQQWKTAYKTILQVSGIAYAYDENRPVDYRIVSAMINGKPIDVNKTYTVAVNAFLASGGSGFSVFTRGVVIAQGPTDLEAVVSYIKSLPQPFTAKIEGRISGTIVK